jgi:hypothetical protein
MIAITHLTQLSITLLARSIYQYSAKWLFPGCFAIFLMY